METLSLFLLRTKQLAVLIAFCLTCGITISQNVPNWLVSSYAEQYFAQMNGDDHAYIDIPVILVDSITINDTTLFYLFEEGNNWVIIANDLRVSPILSYGEGHKTIFQNTETSNDVFLEIASTGLLNLKRIDAHNEPNEKWFVMQTLEEGRETPLLDLREENRWDQFSNNDNTSFRNENARLYNKFCPSFYDVENGRTIVGCTAVAIGQVMWYWRWPDHANIAPTIDVFGTTYGTSVPHYYDWDNMPGRIYDSTNLYKADAIASLLRDCGYAGHATYMVGGTSMTLTNAKVALKNIFKYNVEGPKLFTSGESSFTATIISEIQAGRPVIYQATSDITSKSHTIVLDGYDSNTHTVHINYGWGDVNTGWYNMDGMHGYAHYTIAPRILYNIMPNCIQRYRDLQINSQTIMADSCLVHYSLPNITIGYNENLIVQSGGHLKIAASNCIRIGPGFHAHTGSDVQISIRDFICMDEDELELYNEMPSVLQMPALPTGIFTNNGVVSISPNPVHNVLTIEGCESYAPELTIHSMHGQIVLRTIGTSADVSALPNGIYLLTCNDNGHITQHKFIKQ